MSTKTTFKRIALVTVAALGFGMLSTVPSSAAITSSFALNTNSMTVVGGGTGVSDTPTALIRIDVTSDTNGAGLGAGETITAAVTGVPTGVTPGKTLAANRSDLAFVEVGGGQTTGTSTTTSLTNWTYSDTQTGGANYGATGHTTSKTDGKIDSSNVGFAGMDGNGLTYGGTDTVAASTKVESYYLSIIPTGTGTSFNGVATAAGSNAIDQGVYTVTFTLTDINGNVAGTQTLKIDFVSTSATSGAKLAVATTGTFVVGETLTANLSATKNARATLTNRDGGVIRQHTGATPPITSVVLDSAGDIYLASSAVTSADTGSAGNDFGVLSATSFNLRANDQVYGIHWGNGTGNLAAAGVYTIRSRYGNAENVAAITVYSGGATASTGSMTVTATGYSVLDAGDPYNLPLTTKSATFTVATSPVAVNAPLTFTTTWTGTSPAGDVSPASGSTGAKVVFTDALGKASITVTNSNPQDTSKASVTVTGLSAAVTNSVQWDKPAVTTVTVSPAAQKVKYLSTNVVSAVVTDQWGMPMAGVSLQPTIAGANKPATGTSLATVTTDATGTASITVVDAAATATTTTDTVTFTNTASGVKGSTVLTYVTTVPVIAALAGFYNLADNGTTYSTPVPSTGIYNNNAAGTRLIVTTERNTSTSVTLSASETDDLVAFRFTATDAAGAAVVGVPVVVTASKGAYLRGGSTLRATSRTIVSGTDGYIAFVGGSDVIGASTFTVTAGATVATASIWVGNAATAASARFVTLTGAATGVANGAANTYTASVTDRYGNPVSGVSLSLMATGAAVFQGGSTLVQYTTDSTGSVSFQGTSYAAAGGAGTFKVTATSPAAQFTNVAGYVSTTEVDSTLAAGNASATVAVAFTEGTNAAEANAQAAADAAAEATDAANAATDAANAAAEAADAATAAAQDAADAVAALSTQVAELVSTLRKQITSLTNLVIKIQKKVRA
jgi:trimeric autotransporter adhesin